MGSSNRNRGTRQAPQASAPAPAGAGSPAPEQETPKSEVTSVGGVSQVVVEEPDKEPLGPAPVIGNDGEPVVDESGATVTVDDQGDAPGTVDPEAVTPEQQEREAEVTRADALAKLAGAEPDEPDEEPEPAPEPVLPTGQVIDLVEGSGKGKEYLVLAAKVSYWVHGNFRVARKGDVVRLTAKQAERGLRAEFLTSAD